MAFIPPSAAQRALEIMRSHPLGVFAQIIGNVTEITTANFVTMKSKIGAQRLVDMLSENYLVFGNQPKLRSIMLILKFKFSPYIHIQTLIGSASK